MRVSVGGDVRTRAALPHRRPSQRRRARAQCTGIRPIARLECRPFRGFGLRRAVLRVVMRARARPVRISRTHLLLGMMAARFVRSGLSGRLHEDPHRAALQQHCSGQDEGQPLPPPGMPEWTSGDCHGPNARQVLFPSRHRGAPFTGGRPVTFFLNGPGTATYIDFQGALRRPFRVCSWLRGRLRHSGHTTPRPKRKGVVRTSRRLQQSEKSRPQARGAYASSSFSSEGSSSVAATSASSSSDSAEASSVSTVSSEPESSASEESVVAVSCS